MKLLKVILLFTLVIVAINGKFEFVLIFIRDETQSKNNPYSMWYSLWCINVFWFLKYNAFLKFTAPHGRFL